MAVSRDETTCFWKAKSFRKSPTKMFCIIENIFSPNEKVFARNAPSVKTCLQGQDVHCWLAITGPLAGLPVFCWPCTTDSGIKMATGVKPKMGIGEIKNGSHSMKLIRFLFFSWSDVVCDGDSNRIWNLHHGEFHVSFPPFFLHTPPGRLSAIGSWGVALAIWGLSGVAALCGALSWAGEITQRCESSIAVSLSVNRETAMLSRGSV